MDATLINSRSAASLALLTSLLVASLAGPGCSSSGGGAPSVEAQMSIENVAKWYQLYRSRNRGKAPADEDAFVAFIDEQLAERGDTPINRDETLNSPRDGERYTVRYGEPPARDEMPVVYEQTGDGDGKLYATELGRSREVDDAELQSMLASDEEGSSR